jgi:hypothetical protein
MIDEAIRPGLIYSWDRKIRLTENSVRPSRDDHVLIIMIDAYLGSERTIKGARHLVSMLGLSTLEWF